MQNEQQLSEVLSEFARTMVTDFPIQAILDHLVGRIVDVLPVTSAGVTLISPGSHPQYVAASDEAALRYEALQTELGEGPCLEAYRSGEAVSVPDLREEHRFPAFVQRAIDEGLVAAFTFPLRNGDKRLGALDLYRDTAGALDAATMAAAQTLADVAAAYVLNARARTDLQDSSDRSRELALHDALTGLPNRSLFLERLDHALLRASRSSMMVAVLFADLDQFKRVNDLYGHSVGDELLVAVARRLTAALRPGDTLARLSGDEFVILCEDVEEPGPAHAIARRIGAMLTPRFRLSTATVEMTASIGIAFSGRGDYEAEQVLHDADTAMYQAKRKGGAQHQIIDLREQQLTDQRTNLEHDLHGAVERGEMRVEYQPIVRTSDGSITGMEALARWDHPTRGAIGPGLLIPIAERSQRIIEIGRWVLTQACTDLRRLRMQEARDLTMSVNVSAVQLMAPDYVVSVADVLCNTDTNPEHIVLEVTEGVFVQDSQRALVVLRDLKQLGVRLAIDDFGTGYSSLTYLDSFPLDVVKIDQSFVFNLEYKPSRHSIVYAVIELAHVLCMTVVAEGVETATQHAQLVALDCDSCQGYYFARPMSVDDLESLLRQQRPNSGLACLPHVPVVPLTPATATQ